MADQINAGSDGDAPPAGPRPAERICWRCVFGALPPLLLLLLFGWFAASALERGRIAAEAEAGVSAEMLQDVDLSNEALRAELNATREQLSAARATLAAQGGDQALGAQGLVSRIAELPIQERAALLRRAGVDLAPAPTNAAEAVALLARLDMDQRDDLFAGLPTDPSFAAWFASLSPAEKRSWLERLLGPGTLDAIEIGGQRSPAGIKMEEQRRAALDALRQEASAARSEVEATTAQLTALREEMAEERENVTAAREQAARDAAARAATLRDGAERARLQMEAARDETARVKADLARVERSLEQTRSGAAIDRDREIQKLRADVQEAREEAARLSARLRARPASDAVPSPQPD
ncbi:MAG: hypothetical protein AAF909_10860, partial [Pseudomonadota bacterium]